MLLRTGNIISIKAGKVGNTYSSIQYLEPYILFNIQTNLTFVNNHYDYNTVIMPCYRGDIVVAKQQQTTVKPAFNVYTVQDRGNGQDPFWLKVGAAFPHKDGEGFNIQLQALPTDSRLVLRTYKEQEDSKAA